MTSGLAAAAGSRSPRPSRPPGKTAGLPATAGIRGPRSARTAFREAVWRTYEALKPHWRSEKAAQNWWAHLERHAFPAIGDVPIDRIDRGHVLRVLSPIWTEKPESARRVRRNIRATLQWAVAHGFIERNPAGEAIDGALPPHPSVNSHLRALLHRELPGALETVEASRASVSARLALRRSSSRRSSPRVPSKWPRSAI